MIKLTKKVVAGLVWSGLTAQQAQHYLSLIVSTSFLFLDYYYYYY